MKETMHAPFYLTKFSTTVEPLSPERGRQFCTNHACRTVQAATCRDSPQQYCFCDRQILNFRPLFVFVCFLESFCLFCFCSPSIRMQMECKLRRKIYYIRAEHQRSSGSGSHVHALAGIQAKKNSRHCIVCTELNFFSRKKKTATAN